MGRPKTFSDAESKRYDLQSKGTLAEFYKIGDKKHGIEEGIIAKKMGFGLKSTKNPNSKKYQYKWLIKHQDTYATISDFIGARIMRFFIGDRAPKNKIIRNSQGEILLASRIIEDLKTINKRYGRQNRKKWLMASKDIKEFSFVKALGVFLMDSDRNGGNDSAVPDQDDPSMLVSSGVDFARSLIFYNNFEFLKNDEHIFNQVNQGERLDPSDLVIIATNYWYKMPISIFINDDFIRDLKHIAQIYHSRREEFENVISGLVHKLKEVLSDDVLKDYAKKTTGRRNLEKALKKEFEIQAEKIGYFALCLELQKSIMDNDIEKFKSLIESNLALTFLKIKWLKKQGEETKRNPLPNTVEKYLDLVHKDKPEFQKTLSKILKRKHKEILFEKLLEIEKGVKFEDKINVRNTILEILKICDFTDKNRREELIKFFQDRVINSGLLTVKTVEKLSEVILNRVKIEEVPQTAKIRIEKSLNEILKFFDKSDSKEALVSLSLLLCLAFKGNPESKKMGLAWVEESLKTFTIKLLEISNNKTYTNDFKLINSVFEIGKKAIEILFVKVHLSEKIIKR